jgi:hypothetical protein
MIQDIFDDLLEFLPVLLILLGVFVFWAVLCIAGICSLRSKRKWRKFSCALAPLLLGAVAVLGQIPFSVEGVNDRFSIDLGWFFVVPLLMGLIGVIQSFKTARIGVA